MVYNKFSMEQFFNTISRHARMRHDVQTFNHADLPF